MSALLRFSSLDSSSAEARRQLSDGRLAPFAVAAEHQSAGRGRKGRRWVSQRGTGLYLTQVRALSQVPQPLTLAPLAVGCGLADWLRDLGVPVRLKWPNDLRVDGAKIGGILCEVFADALLVGVGLNWLDAPTIADQRSACLKQFCAKPPGMTDAQSSLSQTIESALNWWSQAGNEALRQRWWAMAEQGLQRSGSLEGEPIGLADDGALRLRDAHGAVHEVRAGEVEVIE